MERSNPVGLDPDSVGQLPALEAVHNLVINAFIRKLGFFSFLYLLACKWQELEHFDAFEVRSMDWIF